MNRDPEVDRSRLLRRLVDHVPSMLAYWDRNLRCRFANRAYETWFGVDPEALIGRRLPDLLGPQLFALNEPHIVAALGGEPQMFERVVPGPNGAQRPSLAHYLPDVIDGRVAGFFVQVTEVTQAKAIEAALRASEAFLDRTGRIAAVGGWEVDLRTDAVTWSAQTRRIHEVAPDYHPTLADAIHFYAPEARPVIEAAVQQGMHDGTPWDMELPLITALGRRIWVRAFGEVGQEDGVPVRLIGAIQDITEHRQREVELQREHALRVQIEHHAQELDALLQERSQMLDVLAHEVRQPLNNASAALQSAVAALSDLSERVAADRLTRAQRVLGQVLASLDNTLAVASLLAGADPIHREDTDIDTLLAVAVADMPADERARIRIERLSGTRTASMDMSLMRLALRNLLSNALAYSPAGSAVTLRLTDSDEPLALVIDVLNSGAAIPADQVAHLFERGARLGLYIVRQVMALHHGQALLAGNGPDGVTMRLVVEQPPDDWTSPVPLDHTAVNGALKT